MNKPSATPPFGKETHKTEASRAVILSILLALATGSNGGCFIGKKINDESKPRTELSGSKDSKTDTSSDLDNKLEVKNRIDDLFNLTEEIRQIIKILLNAEASIEIGLKRMLKVSAYYTPKPGQRFYLHGSYEADMAVNGGGRKSADGTPIQKGTIAAPSSYPFGTVVFIPGLGKGVVRDRGGAIVSKSKHDRIDVWMGHGDEGLKRALNWGMRFVEGKVFMSHELPHPEMDFSGIVKRPPKSTRLKGKTSAKPNQIGTQKANGFNRKRMASINNK